MDFYDMDNYERCRLDAANRVDRYANLHGLELDDEERRAMIRDAMQQDEEYQP